MINIFMELGIDFFLLIQEHGLR